METPITVKKKKVSYSQFSNFYKCPRKWFIDFILNKKVFEDSINTCFGTAIHEVLQNYIKILYTVNTEAADSLDLKKQFQELFKRELSDKNVKHTEDEFIGFVFDGQDILDEFMKPLNRVKHFPSKKYEFIGVEFPITVDIRNQTQFVAYIDLILKDKETGIYKIYDFKTSTMGWNKWAKEDTSKTSQLLIYKAFYSRVFNIPLNMIEVEFFILKRKLYENVEFPQSRIQNFTPDNTKRLIIESVTDFTEFVDTCFTTTGEYNKESDYFKNPGKNKKHCKFCPHYKTEHCDGKPS